MPREIKSPDQRYTDPRLTKLERIEEGAKGVGTAVASGFVIFAGVYANMAGKNTVTERGMEMLRRSHDELRLAVTGVRPSQLPEDIWDFLGL